MLCNFIEIALRHWCSPPNLLHIFRTPFSRNASEWLLLELNEMCTGFKETEEKDHIYEKIREKVDERFRSVYVKASYLTNKSGTEEKQPCFCGQRKPYRYAS